jgi:hypothetical protein
VISALRLLRHPPLIGERGVALGESLDQLEKEATKQWKDERVVNQFALIMAKKQLEQENDREVSDEAIKETANLICHVEKKNLKPYFVSYPCISRVKELMSSVVIRRDHRSLTPEGAKVLNLIPYFESILRLPPSQIELDALAQIASNKPAAV